MSAYMYRADEWLRRSAIQQRSTSVPDLAGLMRVLSLDRITRKQKYKIRLVSVL